MCLCQDFLQKNKIKPDISKMDVQPPPKQNKLINLFNSAVCSTKAAVDSAKDYLAKKNFEDYMKKEIQFYRKLSKKNQPLIYQEP